MPVRARTAFVALVFAITIVAYADRQVIALLKPALDQSLGWTAADYAGITTLFQIAATLSLLGAGWFVDRVGIARAVGIGLGGWSLAAIAHAAARTVAQFATARVALGVCEAVGTPAMVKSVAILFPPERRALVLGILNVAPNVAAIATPLLVSILFERLGWQRTVVAIGAAGLVLLGLWMVLPFVRLSPLLVARVHGGGMRPAKMARPAMVRLLADPGVWRIGLAKLLIDQAWWFMLFWLPDFFHRRHGLDVHRLGAPLAVVYALAAAGAFAGGALPLMLANRGIAVARARRIVMGVSALTVLPVAAVAQLDSTMAAVLVIGVALASHQAFSTNLFALIADRAPVSEVGSVMGFAAFCGNLGGILSLHLAGLSLTALGTLQPLFMLMASGYGLAWCVLGAGQGAPARLSR